MEIFEKPRLCLEIMGHGKKWNLSMRFHFIIVLITLSLSVSMTYFAISSINDLIALTSSISIILINMASTVKICAFCYKKYEFLSVMEIIQNILNTTKNPKDKKDLTATNKNSEILGRWYFYLCQTTGAYFLTTPIIKALWAKFQGQPITSELPFPMKFPFEHFYFPVFQILYVYTCFVSIVVTTYLSIVDGIYISFTFNLRAYFKILQRMITENTYQKTDKELQQDLKEIVEYHCFALDLSERIRRLYEPIIIDVFLVSSLQVCMIIIQILSNAQDLTALITNASFLCTILLQLFMYCYGGQIIMNESEQVNIAVQYSKWYNLTPKYQRALCLVMQRSQRPIIMTAGFFQATLESFLKIVQAAVSYVTLVQSLDGEKI